ncbi:unnamed protein product [Arabis nemorensis]|uniref:NYN domain-containing protein n=1 Tax=Arabis nemorensis TaxID=586526 RepID=A0A565C210_9BRAS|nr:unnamed protein product [Arabis nemorensis]
MSADPKACVFLDMEDLPFPFDYMRRSLVQFGFPDDFSITAYVDEGKFTDDLVDVYRRVGMTILPVKGGKYARVHRILMDIVLWAMANPATYFKPLDLVVISANIKEESDFLRALEALGDRYYNIILALPHELPSTKLPTVKWERSDVLVFWNVEDPIDIDYDHESLYTPIAKALDTKGYYGEVSIMAYADNEDFKIPSSDALKKFTVLTKDEGDDGYAKVTRMFLDMLFWVMNNNDEPSHFIMISRPSEYTTKWPNVVQALEGRGFNVILGPSDAIRLPLSIESFTSLCKDIPRSTRGVKEYLELQKFSGTEKCIFWVIEKFPSDPMEIPFIVERMKETLKKKGYTDRYVSVMAYFDDEKLMEVESIPGMTVTLLPPQEKKSTKVTRLLADMLLFARRNCDETTSLIVIAESFKDARFERVAESLRGLGYNVLSTHLDHMITFGTALWSSRSRAM